MDCKYEKDIGRMKTDTAVLLAKMDDVQKDFDKLANKIDKLSSELHNGLIENKVEKAIDARNGRLLWKLIVAIVSSSAVMTWVMSLFGGGGG
jgi:predicted RNase H-like nuclease (RuvC/YqgF family)